MNIIGPSSSVPYFSQLEDITDSDWQHQACGVTALYMVLAYFWDQRNQAARPSLDELLEFCIKSEAYDGKWWVHSKLAEVARHYGFSALARSWFIRPTDINIMLEQKRLSDEAEVKHYRQQVEQEFIRTVSSELQKDVPVIVSVKPGLGLNLDNHLVVIVGFNEANQSFIYHDPQGHAEEGKEQEVTQKTLLEFCNFNAIFVFN